MSGPAGSAGVDHELDPSSQQPPPQEGADDEGGGAAAAAAASSAAGTIRFHILGGAGGGRKKVPRGGVRAGLGLDFGHDSGPHPDTNLLSSSLTTGGKGESRRHATSFSKEEESADKSLPVIPVKPNTRLQPTADRETTDGRPEDVLSGGSVRPSAVVASSSSAVISAATPPSPPNSRSAANDQREAEQYQRQVEELPDEPTLDDYRRSETAIPISQFGAALLRGMGWKDDDNGGGKTKDEEAAAMPRPHRLGLGAIPKAAAAAAANVGEVPGSRGGGNAATAARPRRPDQVRQDERLRSQLAEFAAQKAERIARDKQAVLQDGSVVRLHLDDGARRGTRAKVVQLVGVPGLNKVRVALERDPARVDGGDDGEAESSRQEVIVNRLDIGDLVSRSELAARPFVEASALRSNGIADRRERSQRKRRRGEDDRDESTRKDPSRKRDYHEGSDHDSFGDRDSHRRGKDRKKEKKRDRPERDQRSRDNGTRVRSEDRNGSRQPPSASGGHDDAWLIPHIRVRVATTKYGQRHFQQKGVVVDVTPKGATVQMDDGKRTLLDRVPARHLTTALPKVGGAAVVVQGEHKRAMGTILQRDSRAAVLQLHEDHSVLTLSLDDLAEWCGPRMDE